MLLSTVNFHPSYFLDVWDKLVFGILGIFVVTGVIIGVTALLNKLTEKKK
jgi:hypothetical protein